MRSYANSIEFLEWQYYHPNGRAELYRRDPGALTYAFKKDADVTTGVTGVYQATYGAATWNAFNHEANMFGALPKYAATKTGWRLLTADAGSAADGGVSEDGAIPATIKPTFLAVSATPKTIAHAFSASEVQTAVGEAGDDVTGDMSYLRGFMSSKHKNAINEQLLRDVDSTADTRIESIDRVVSSAAEVANLGITANDADIYGIDRDVAGHSDAVVNDNAGVDRDLTDTLLTNLVDNTKEAGGNNNLWVTGTDTYAAIQQLFEPQVRYSVVKETMAQLTSNGIQTPEGIRVGITVANLYGINLIVTKDVVKDTISRVYLLDTSDPEGHGQPRLGMRMHRPTQYFENGIANGDPFGINRFADEGVYRTMGELICYRLDVNGKVRDLK